MSFQVFTQCVIQCYYQWRLFVYLLFVQYTSPRTLSIKRSGTERNIVLLGDDFCYGTGGDQGLGKMGGPGRYLLDILSRSNKIRQTWRIHNCGQPGSNSKDWIPKSVYFERLPQAEFAIVIVGSNDYLSLAAQDTLDYVHMICQELEKRGTTVILCPVSSRPSSDNIERNELINGYIESHKTIIGGPQMHELNYEYRGDFLYNGDYFSARGYKKLASDLADLLENRMVKMEFNSLKNLLFKK